MPIKKYGLLFIIWLLVGKSFAIGVPNLDIDQLVNPSDVVAIVEFRGEKSLDHRAHISFQNQIIQSRVFSAEYEIAKFIKGSTPKSITVSYNYPAVFLGYRKPGHGIRIVFLRELNGRYTFTSPYYPDLPAQLNVGSGFSLVYPVENVIQQAVGVIASTKTTLTEKREILGVDYALPPNKFVTDAFKQGLISTRDPLTREKILSDLIGFGDITELPDAVQMLLTNTVSEDGKSWLLYSIGQHVRDSRAISSLQLLYQSKNAAIRVTAMEALWHIDNSKAIELFAQGLIDPSQDVKYYAVRGLADITGKPQWGPSIPEFQEHGSRYVDYWLAQTGQSHREK